MENNLLDFGGHPMLGFLFILYFCYI